MGVGIAPEQLERIFDEFVQLSNPERDRRPPAHLLLSHLTDDDVLLRGYYAGWRLHDTGPGQADGESRRWTSRDEAITRNHQCKTLGELVDLTLRWLTDRKCFRVRDEAYLPAEEEDQAQAA
jgi:hypothetical protein